VLVLSEGSASQLFTAACSAVVSEGRRVAPRGMATLEILGASLTLTDPRRRLVDVPPVRVLNPAFAAAEAVWILSGSDEPWIYQFNRKLADYADDGRLMGAYGPRLRRWHGVTDQLAQVRQLLRGDPDTRRAVVQLFDPGSDFRGYRDVPCTLGYRFYLRGGLLHMHTTMRSQDLWRGFCYDIFTATLLQELLAGWLGAGLGTYLHQVDSLHLYEQDLPGAERLPQVTAPGPVAAPLSVPWADFDDMLARVISGDAPAAAGWAEISGVLTSYRIWKAGDRGAAYALAEQAGGSLAAALCRWYERLGGRGSMVAVPGQDGEHQ
jgi:thymidylate synthase